MIDDMIASHLQQLTLDAETSAPAPAAPADTVEVAKAVDIQRIYRGGSTRVSIYEQAVSLSEEATALVQPWLRKTPWQRAADLVPVLEPPPQPNRYISIGDRMRIVRQKSSVCRSVISIFHEKRVEMMASVEGGGVTDEDIEEVLRAGREQLERMQANAAMDQETIEAEEAAQKAEAALAAVRGTPRRAIDGGE